MMANVRRLAVSRASASTSLSAAPWSWGSVLSNVIVAEVAGVGKQDCTSPKCTALRSLRTAGVGEQSSAREQIPDLRQQHLFVRWCRGSDWLGPSCRIHGFDDEEQCERHDDEVDDRVDENAIRQDHRARVLGELQRWVRAWYGRGLLEDDELIREVHSSHPQTDDRHHDVSDEARNDCAERQADDDAHGHVDDIAAHRELLEFPDHLFLACGMCPLDGDPPGEPCREAAAFTSTLW